MKNFFTCFIAVLLLCLCLLENEAKKNAILTENKNLVQVDKTSQESTVNQNFSGKMKFQDNINMVVSDRTSVMDSRKYIATDSLSFL